MICTYLDDAGNTGTNLMDTLQPIHYVGALMVPESAWAASKAGVEGVKLFALENGFGGDDCELHGVDILQGKGGWRGMSFTSRISVLAKAVEVMEVNQLRLARGGCNKILLEQRYFYPDHPHSIALWLCLERVASFANAKKQLTVLIADDCASDFKELSRKTLLRYRTHGAPFGPTVDFSYLIDTIHFMHSHESAHIQLCDIAMYIHQRYQLKKEQCLEELWYRCNRLYYGVSVIPY